MQEHNRNLQEEFNSLQAEQHIVFCRLEALEECQRGKLILLDDSVSFKQHGESNTRIVPKELSDHYSPVNSPKSHAKHSF